MDIEKIFNKLDGMKDEMVSLQRELVRRPALAPENGGNGEWEKGLFLMNYLRGFGWQIHEYHAPDERVLEGKRPNFSVLFDGEDRGRRIWIMTHIDVVPPGDRKLWNSDPFELHVEGDKMFGRGTEDNHQGLVSAIFSVKAIMDEGLTPLNSIGLLFVSDEETGNSYGIEYLLKNNQIFGKNDLFVVPDGGLPDGSMLEIAEKTIIWLRFTTYGKQCHGALPHLGINAHKAGANLIVRLDDLYRIFSDRDELFSPPISTFEPTKKETNVPNINTIPGEDVLCFDCRILPKIPVETFMQKVREIKEGVERDFSVRIDIETPQFLPAAPPTPVDSPLVKALARHVNRVYGVSARPMGIGGGTVAAFLRNMGYHAVVWSKLEETCHQPNEYSLISNMIGDAKVFASLFMNPLE